MTHYTVSYEGMTGIEAHRQAIQDVKEWLGGEKNYQELCAAAYEDVARDGPFTLDQFLVIASFCGIRGYSARAWYDELWPPG